MSTSNEALENLYRFACDYDGEEILTSFDMSSMFPTDVEMLIDAAISEQYPGQDFVEYNEAVPQMLHMCEEAPSERVDAFIDAVVEYIKNQEE